MKGHKSKGNTQNKTNKVRNTQPISHITNKMPIQGRQQAPSPQKNIRAHAQAPMPTCASADNQMNKRQRLQSKNKRRKEAQKGGNNEAKEQDTSQRSKTTAKNRETHRARMMHQKGHKYTEKCTYESAHFKKNPSYKTKGAKIPLYVQTRKGDMHQKRKSKANAART